MLSSKIGKTTKVVVCGMKSVGKTAILEQSIYGNLNAETELYPTIEDIYIGQIETDRGTKEKVRFYDTAGIDRSQTNTASGTTTNQQLPRQYFGFADGYLLVYDAERPESLDVLFALKKDIDKNKDKKEVTIVVVANQTSASTSTERDAVLGRANAWCAREKVRHFVVDAMLRPTLYEAFVYLASRLNPPPSKTTFPQLSMGRKGVKVDNS